MHQHSHHPPHHHENERRLRGVLFLSGTYMVAEIIGGIWSGSLTLFADAGHMAIDTAAVALGLFAIWIAKKPPTDKKTFGYYRAEILAALLNGAALVAVAIWIFHEAWVRFNDPREVQGKLMLGIAAGGLVVNLIALWIMHHEDRHAHNLNMRSVWLHLLSDTLGSVGAIIAGFLVWKFQWYTADAIASAIIGALILFGAWKLLSECVDVLLEGVPKGIHIVDIKTRIEAHPQVRDVHDLHVWVVTSGVSALSAHIGVKEGANHTQVLGEITHLLDETFGIKHVTLQLDPPTFSKCDLHF